ncbi:MAG: hypothetical protein OXC96_04220 [Cyanobacteria bacterium MAG CAR1_bin_15]|nr:hypothetical protein [Cyanobacteria bacterium MAG CAR1_bin_15]
MDEHKPLRSPGKRPPVSIVMGSDSDLPTIAGGNHQAPHQF